MPKSKDSATGTTEVTLTFDKETKNTYRFATDDDKAAVSTVYINKSALNGAKVGDSTKLTLSITIS